MKPYTKPLHEVLKSNLAISTSKASEVDVLNAVNNHLVDPLDDFNLTEMLYLLSKESSSKLKMLIQFNNELKISMLYELEMQEKIKIAGFIPIAIDNVATGDILLDKMLLCIIDGENPLLQFQKVRSEIKKNLARKGFNIKVKKNEIKRIKELIRRRLKDVVLANKRVDDRFSLLAIILKRLGILQVVFSEKELPVARPAIKLLRKRFKNKKKASRRIIKRPIILKEKDDKSQANVSSKEPVKLHPRYDLALANARVEEKWNEAMDALAEDKLDRCARKLISSVVYAVDQACFETLGKQAKTLEKGMKQLSEKNLLKLNNEDVVAFIALEQSFNAGDDFSRIKMNQLITLSRYILMDCAGTKEEQFSADLERKIYNH